MFMDSGHHRDNGIGNNKNCITDTLVHPCVTKANKILDLFGIRVCLGASCSTTCKKNRKPARTDDSSHLFGILVGFLQYVTIDMLVVPKRVREAKLE
jgi:hypothetical protein